MIEAASEERHVGESLARIQQLMPSTPDREEPCVDRRKRLESMTRDASGACELPPGQPSERKHRRRMHSRSLPRGLELDEQVRTGRSVERIIEQATQDRRSQRERDVPEGSPPSRRKRDPQDIAVHDTHMGIPSERSLECLNELTIEFDRRDPGGLLGERQREPPGARADLEHMIGWEDVRVTNELSRDQPTAKEVLTVRPSTVRLWRARVRAHEPSP